MTRSKTNDYNLTDLEDAFCVEYACGSGFNKVEAMRRAGYNYNASTDASRQAAIILSKEGAQKRIKEIITERDGIEKVDKSFVIERLMKVVEETPKNTSAHVRSLELLGKHLGMFSDKHIFENSGEDAGKKAQEIFKERFKVVELQKDGTNDAGEAISE